MSQDLTTCKSHRPMVQVQNIGNTIGQYIGNTFGWCGEVKPWPSGIVPTPSDVDILPFGRYIEAGPKMYSEFWTTTFSISASESKGTCTKRPEDEISMVISAERSSAAVF